jgi:hypothetical protein
MKNFLLSLTAIMFLASCSAIGPKTEILHNRLDANSKISKVIIFPTTDLSGKISVDAKAINPSVIAGYGSVYGADKTIPGGLVIEKITNNIGNNFYATFIAPLDNPSAIDINAKNPKVKKFIAEVNQKLGNYQFVVAVLSGSQSDYDSGNPVSFHLGLYDTKNSTWKLITKTTTKKMIGVNWKTASQSLIAKGFSEFKKLNSTQK